MQEVDYTKIFHTVPFSAPDLHRLPTGEKSNPGYPDNWIQYQSKRNTKNTPVLGAIAREDFIGIDIDNTEVFNQALEADNDTAEYVARSDKKGGHLLYAYNVEDAMQLQMISSLAKKANIDIQMKNKLIYLATPANKTKTLLTEPLTELPKSRIPKAVLSLIYMHTFKHVLQSTEGQASIVKRDFAEYNPDIMANSTLGYLVNVDKLKALSPKELAQALDKILPSKLDYRHPKDVPPGEGTAFMTSIRFKLAQDPSISETQFKEFMCFLDSLWQDPMGEARVLADCAYDIKTRLNPVTSKVLWAYNEDWQKEGFIYESLYGDIVEVMYDSDKALYIEHNRTTNTVHIHDKLQSITNSILVNSKQRLKVVGEKLLRKTESVQTIETPTELPGKVARAQERPLFNLYVPSEGTQILSGQVVVKNPRIPENILKFLEHLIPDEGNRKRLCQFLVHKHTTYEHSDLYFVFAGVGGAGKNIFIEHIMGYFSGTQRMAKANLDLLMNNFNKWMVRTDYVIVDEAGEGASKASQEKLVAELKKITGSPLITVTQKGKDTGVPQRHYMTPILNTNMATKLITDISQNDRRLVLFKCPTKLSATFPNTDKFFSDMIEELPHFAHWLRSLEPIPTQVYKDNGAWKNKDYEDYIRNTINPIDKIVEAVETNNLDLMMEVLTDDIGATKQSIDSMFSLSKEGARMVLYHTSSSRESGLSSLYDIAESSNVLSSVEIKTKLSKYKVRTSHKMDHGIYNINVIEFKDRYIPLTEVAPIEAEDVDI